MSHNNSQTPEHKDTDVEKNAGSTTYISHKDLEKLKKRIRVYAAPDANPAEIEAVVNACLTKFYESDETKNSEDPGSENFNLRLVLENYQLIDERLSNIGKHVVDIVDKLSRIEEGYARNTEQMKDMILTMKNEKSDSRRRHNRRDKANEHEKAGMSENSKIAKVEPNKMPEALHQNDEKQKDPLMAIPEIGTKATGQQFTRELIVPVRPVKLTISELMRVHDETEPPFCALSAGENDNRESNWMLTEHKQVREPEDNINRYRFLNMPSFAPDLTDRPRFIYYGEV